MNPSKECFFFLQEKKVETRRCQFGFAHEMFPIFLFSLIIFSLLFFSDIFFMMVISFSYSDSPRSSRRLPVDQRLQEP